MNKLFLLLATVYITPAMALTCLDEYSGEASCANSDTTAGDCKSLGYSTNDVDGCVQYLKCPFDTSYKRCVAKTDDTDENTTQTDTSCRIGYIFYSDGSCSNVENYDSAKTPVGVVYALSASKGSVPYRSENELHTSSLHGRVIALKDLTFDSNYIFNPYTPYSNGNKKAPFGLYKYDIASLTEYTEDDDTSGILYALGNGVKSIFDGKSATYTLSHQYSNSIGNHMSTYNCKVNNSFGYYQGADANSNVYCFSSPALASYYFYPPNISASNSIAGQNNWYLPSLGELMLLYGYKHNQIKEIEYDTGSTLETVIRVNTTLKKLKLSGVDVDLLPYHTYSGEPGNDDVAYSVNTISCHYLSSTRYDSKTSWTLSSGYRYHYPTNDGSNTLTDFNCVRPSLEF